jgi:hypothetical protein
MVGHRGMTLLGWLVALDDLVEHPWGSWTALDSIVWSEWIVSVLNWARKSLRVVHLSDFLGKSKYSRLFLNGNE